MRFVLFYHSLVSDWNHGNAHFLRGVAAELIARGHAVDVYEPADGWSLENLRTDHGEAPLKEFVRAFPRLSTRFYRIDDLDLDAVLDGADVVVVHEWSEHELVRRVGEHHARSPHYRLLFHDTHHRAVTDPESVAAYDFSSYDGVLAFGRIIRDLYLSEGWTHRAWTWHEAADTRIFHPIPGGAEEGDLVWIGNWGDDERASELEEFLVQPVRALGLRARVYGVRYPDEARKRLAQAGIDYGGWLPNHRVPEIFARFQATIHVPRRPYRESIPGIPTIRVFEALACGIPLVCAHWEDLDNLFTPGKDYLVAQTGEEMTEHLKRLVDDPELAQSLAEHGLKTIRARHTCAHRVDELLEILRELNSEAEPAGSDAWATR